MNAQIYTPHVEQVYQVACPSLGDPLVTDPKTAGPDQRPDAGMCRRFFSCVCVFLTERTAFKLISFSSKQYTHSV